MATDERERRVAIILPWDVKGIDDTQRAFGPCGDNLEALVSESEFIELDWPLDAVRVGAAEQRVRELEAGPSTDGLLLLAQMLTVGIVGWPALPEHEKQKALRDARIYAEALTGRPLSLAATEAKLATVVEALQSIRVAVATTRTYHEYAEEIRGIADRALSEIGEGGA